MARTATKLILTEKQGAVLKLFSNSRTGAAHLQERASIILRCAQGKTNIEIMHELKIHKKTVSKWRNRWAVQEERLLEIDKKEEGIAYQRLIETILNDAPRSGTPPTFTAKQICLILNVACELPAESHLPLSHWSLPSLSDELVKRKIVKSISTSQLQVFLKSGKYKTPQSGSMDSYPY
jgi:putative transposase